MNENLVRGRYRVISNKRMETENELWDMFVDAPELVKNVLPGQIAHFFCGGNTTLRRPISVCDCCAGTLRFCYEVRGEGTRLLSQLKSGDFADILAPGGNGFTLPERGTDIVLAGGGIGVFPLLSLAGRCADLDCNVTALLGFRDASHVSLAGDFRDYGAEVEIISDDGSTGRKGFVTELLSKHLDRQCTVYICGPRAMMKACAKMCVLGGVKCEVSMEERMACGVGACLGCVCDTTQGLKRVCVDGPVFDGAKILWDAPKTSGIRER